MATGLLVAAVLAAAALYGFIWDRDVRGWRTWGFRLGHEVVATPEVRRGGFLMSRDVYFVLRAGEDSRRAVQACAAAFAHAQTLETPITQCRAFGSARDARIQLQRPDLNCERARSRQEPYMDAEHASVTINTGERCARRTSLNNAGTGFHTIKEYT
ncbi:hypothetical protein CBQ26_08270 [Deinococcus indicus]|uniref:Uncharacterized protein n=2 Tax=Deinococcus indicus TaxID=223556 RepID=A0A2D0A7I9_9DEIO|nr:hypothetical protein CBQ26_08270 [Deinococcus indicus]GHG22023.1 hypothetical protein GCM10017784_12080 [Deinococcus indicus]